MARRCGIHGTPLPARAASWLFFCTMGIVDVAIVFLILGILQPYLYDLNALLGSVTGTWLNYMLLFGLIAGAFIAWFLALIARCKSQLRRGTAPFKPGRFEAAVSASMLVVWNLLYAVLGTVAGGEVFIVLRFIEGVSLYLYMALNGILVLFLFKAIPSISRLARGLKALPARRVATRVAAISAIVAVYATGFTLPFFAISPTFTSDPLPSKPFLIGHRGASNYAPENTLAAVSGALQFGVAGWEVDVQVSIDGAFFLMHDDDLRRTTDVEAVFPGQESRLACDFTISQLRSLDAGSWFTDDDPYCTIASGIVPRAMAESYRGVQVPTLEEAIAFSEIHGLILEIDFKAPPDDHPFHDTARNQVIALLNSSTLGKNAWVYTRSPDAANLSRVCTRSCSVESVRANSYDLVNLNLDIPNAQLMDYYRHGITTVVYTVDNVQTFSTLWALGVTYVKTNRPWLFTGLEQPVPRMDLAQYTSFWGAFLTAGCGFVAAYMFTRQRRPGRNQVCLFL